MHISINHKPVRATRTEVVALHKELLKALELISSNPNATIVGEKKTYTIADFKTLQEFEHHLEYYLQKD